MDLLDDLRLFIEIADLGNMSAVARRRAVAPSTVTLSLKRLETRLGAQLVTRSTRKLSLTSEGEQFLADCKRILGQLDEAMDSMTEQGPLAGPLRITAMHDFGRNRLAPLVHRFMTEHPQVHISLMLSDSLVDLVEDGVDIGIRTGPLQDSTLKARLLIQGSACICAAPAYWQRRGMPSHPRDLTEHNCLVMSRPSGPQSNWHFSHQNQGFTVKVAGDRMGSDGGLLRHWAIEGAGVVKKASWDVAQDVAQGRLQKALTEYTKELVNLYAVYPAGRLSRRARAFIDFLAQSL